MSESRLEELRRRIRKDPASLVFAQLAEELRRAGHLDEAIGVCRAGLAAHPGYPTARVTLGRALAERGEFDAGRLELEAVVRTAPEHLAARRSLAEVYHRSGRLADALAGYQAALALAPGDHDLQERVRLVALEVEAPPSATEASAPPGPAAPAGRGEHRAAEQARRTVAELERWLIALHGTRARRHA